MNETSENRTYKGGTFINRYCFCGKLIALSSFHIGSGETTTHLGLKNEENAPVKINAVITDAKGRPYIPGSTLRGCLRAWATEQFGNAKLVEGLFGDIEGEGKIEVWNAHCLSDVVEDKTTSTERLHYFDNKRLTYVAKSIAIDPETGTAEDKKLFHYELVPAGTSFDVTISAQNLGDKEVTMVLDILDRCFLGDNPVVIGSMGKHGFGLFAFECLKIFRVDKDDGTLQKWIENSTKSETAGYESIMENTFALDDNKINEIKKKVSLTTKKVPESKTVTWKLTLATPLCIKSGNHFAWKNTSHKKSRNCMTQFKWNETNNIDEKLNDLYYSIRLEADKTNPGKLKVVPYYNVPASSIRGLLREWTITRLLPEGWWDIDTALKKFDRGKRAGKVADEPPEHLRDIVRLFGSAVQLSYADLAKDYSRAGSLRIKVEPFEGIHARPDMDGTWNTANEYGPNNARRHIKPRNPLDRVTQAAVETGLHNFLEFSKGQSFKVTFTIRNAVEKGDESLLNWWKDEINEGMIRFGGVTGIGRGRMTCEEGVK